LRPKYPALSLFTCFDLSFNNPVLSLNDSVDKLAALTYIRLLDAPLFVLSPNEIQDDFLSYTGTWPQWPQSFSGFEEVKTV